MKRIVAMLLVAAALACCAGCGASGAGATTTMTEEDFYVYENGEVVQGGNSLDHTFEEKQETKRGIHIGNTLQEVEEAYKGEQVLWRTDSKEDYQLDDFGGHKFDGKKLTLLFMRVKGKDTELRSERADYKMESGSIVYSMKIQITEDVIENISIWNIESSK